MKKIIFLFLLVSVVFSSCKKDIGGCMDIESLNYNSEATIDDGSCEYLRDKIIGDWEVFTMELSNFDVVGLLYDDVNATFNSSGRNEWNLDKDVGTDRKITASWEVDGEELKLEVDLDSFNICDQHHYTFDITFESEDLLRLNGFCSDGDEMNFGLRRR